MHSSACAHGLCLKCNYAEAKKERDQLRAEVGKLRAQLEAVADKWKWSEAKTRARRATLDECARELRAILAEGGS